MSTTSTSATLRAKRTPHHRLTWRGASSIVAPRIIRLDARDAGRDLPGGAPVPDVPRAPRPARRHDPHRRLGGPRARWRADAGGAVGLRQVVAPALPQS